MGSVFHLVIFVDTQFIINSTVKLGSQSIKIVTQFERVITSFTLFEISSICHS